MRAEEIALGLDEIRGQAFRGVGLEVIQSRREGHARDVGGDGEFDGGLEKRLLVLDGFAEIIGNEDVRESRICSKSLSKILK